MNTSSISLYICTSQENNWPHGRVRYDGIHVTWFVSKRDPNYADQYAGLFDASDPYQRGQIEEAFTAEESQQFAAYLKARHNSSVATHPVELPVPADTMPMDWNTVGGDTDFHMLDGEDGYSLPFRVWGFYRVHDAVRVAGSEFAGSEPVITYENIEAAITRVAVAAFHANLGEETLMSLNRDGLIAFRLDNGISQKDMNIAWSELERRYLERLNQ